MKGSYNNMYKLFQEQRSIKWIEAQKNYIDFSPTYQRPGKIWKRPQKQLLIDSILNGFDLPKFYFQFMPPVISNRQYSYAIIDGKQRLEAILGFLSGEFPLSENFKFFDSELSLKYGCIAGTYFDDIDQFAPAIAARFLQFEISIVFLDTSTPETVDEMFIRLNSGVPVSTAEKRNANGGLLSRRIQDICNSSPFFTDTIRISNSRLQHNDLALKLLMLESGALDLTTGSVNRFVADNKDVNCSCQLFLEKTTNKVHELSEIFNPKDKLLSKKNIIITLYYIFDSIPHHSLRSYLDFFETQRTHVQNELNAIDNDDLIEFSRLLQQGADKKSSITKRGEIMLKFYSQYLQSTCIN